MCLCFMYVSAPAFHPLLAARAPETVSFHWRYSHQRCGKACSVLVYRERNGIRCHAEHGQRRELLVDALHQ
jgi:hypothetical protein